MDQDWTRAPGSEPRARRSARRGLHALATRRRGRVEPERQGADLHRPRGRRNPRRPRSAISARTRGGREARPDQELLFNACLFDAGGTEIWFGDISLPADVGRLEKLAASGRRDLPDAGAALPLGGPADIAGAGSSGPQAGLISGGDDQGAGTGASSCLLTRLLGLGGCSHPRNPSSCVPTYRRHPEVPRPRGDSRESSRVVLRRSDRAAGRVRLRRDEQALRLGASHGPPR